MVLVDEHNSALPYSHAEWAHSNLGHYQVSKMVMVTLSGEHDWRMQLIVNDFLFLFLQANSYALMMGTFTKYFTSAHQRAHE